MNILMLGDVVGDNGCRFLLERLPRIRRELKVELTVVNGENSAEGNGILPSSARQLWNSGADVITLGNHGLRRREIYQELAEREELIRPANYHPSAPGRGFCIYDRPGLPRTAVVNLSGSCFMDAYRNPFDVMDELLPQLVVGTHTHIQTADERILPGGTGYITDLGMCGSFNSVLGVRPELAINRFRTGLPTRFLNDSGPCRMSGVLLSVDHKTGKTTKIERVNVE